MEALIGGRKHAARTQDKVVWVQIPVKPLVSTEGFQNFPSPLIRHDSREKIKKRSLSEETPSKSADHLGARDLGERKKTSWEAMVSARTILATLGVVQLLVRSDLTGVASLHSQN